MADYGKDFYLDVSENGNSVSGVLYQKDNQQRRVLSYLSAPLEVIEQKQPPCARFVAGLAKMIIKAEHIVMGHPLKVLSNHSVVSFITSSAFSFSALRQQKMIKTVTAPNILHMHTGVNMAELMGEGESHDCEPLAETDNRVRQDLTGVALAGEVLNLFSDGCCFRKQDGTLSAAFAVVRMVGEQGKVMAAEKLEGRQSAQRAELLGLIAALQAGRGQRVNIYCDSAYAVSAALTELPGWARCGFVTSTGKPIKHAEEAVLLLKSVMLPEQVAIVKCAAHTGGTDMIALGNSAADEAAKQTAGYTVHQLMVTSCDELTDIAKELTVDFILSEQQRAAAEEKSQWISKGGKVNETGLWIGPGGKPTLPASTAVSVLKEAHSLAHSSERDMTKRMTAWWHPFMPHLISSTIANCKICQEHNVKPALKPGAGHFPTNQGPGHEVVMNFTDMIVPVNGKRYLLVMVDGYSGWPEAYPCKKEDAISVVKCLVNQYIPRHGFPKLIRSDNGTHFKNDHLEQVETTLGLKHRYGAVWHPQSQGKVECMNLTIKQKLAKICDTMGMNWVSALPIALMSIRCSINRSTGLTPFELVTGRQFPGPWAPFNISAGTVSTQKTL